MTVILHAQNQAPEADYTAMDEPDQQRFDEVMAIADGTSSNGEYLALMLAAATLAGLHIPYGGEIRKCGCSCWCGTVFDPNTPGAHVIRDGDGYNLGSHQCPTCADRHRETA